MKTIENIKTTIDNIAQLKNELNKLYEQFQIEFMKKPNWKLFLERHALTFDWNYVSETQKIKIEVIFSKEKNEIGRASCRERV